MTTTRTPIGRPPVSRIPLKAVAAFKLMLKLEERCSCEPVRYPQYGEPCKACDQWWEQHSILHNLLRLPIWRWPAFENPDAECPYPAGSYFAERWQRHRTEYAEEFDLYHALKKAADDALEAAAAGK